MIIARSPLRITLGGGGTDLPSYYENHEGFLISAAINKYVYVTVMRPFAPGIFLKYSELEHALRVHDVKHPIIREALKSLPVETSQIEIATLADIPAGTGLGSSGSFTCALLTALFAHHQLSVTPRELAERACHIEIERLGEPIGKQDQYIAAVGGINCYTFHMDNQVSMQPLAISSETLTALEDNLLLFFTGFSRRAADILREQHLRSKAQDESMLQHLHYVKKLGYLSKKALEEGEINQFGELMHAHWEHKKSRSDYMSNPSIDAWYQLGMQNGASGGKLVGAGGGGFLLFLAHDHDKLRHAMHKEGLEEVRFQFDFSGSQVVLSS